MSCFWTRRSSHEFKGNESLEKRTAAVSKTSRRDLLSFIGTFGNALDRGRCCGWSSTQPRSVQLVALFRAFPVFPVRSIPAKSPSNRMDIMMMRFISATTAGLLFLTFHAPAASADFEKLKADAEKQYADGSYALAHETYARAPRSKRCLCRIVSGSSAK